MEKYVRVLHLFPLLVAVGATSHVLSFDDTILILLYNLFLALVMAGGFKLRISRQKPVTKQDILTVSFAGILILNLGKFGLSLFGMLLSVMWALASALIVYAIFLKVSKTPR